MSDDEGDNNDNKISDQDSSDESSNDHTNHPDQSDNDSSGDDDSKDDDSQKKNPSHLDEKTSDASDDSMDDNSPAMHEASDDDEDASDNSTAKPSTATRPSPDSGVRARLRQSSLNPKCMKETTTKHRIPFTHTEKLWMFNFILDKIVDEETGVVSKFPSGTAVWNELSKDLKNNRKPASYYVLVRRNPTKFIDESSFDIQTKAVLHFGLDAPCTPAFLQELTDAGGDYLLDDKNCLRAFRKLNQPDYDLWYEVWTEENEKEFEKQAPKRKTPRKRRLPLENKDVPSTSAQ